MRLPGALKQPLPYFVLLGVAVFLLDAWLRRASATIQVSPGVRREVAARLEQQLVRPPTPAELDRGLRDWADTERLFREAIELGLDENDAVIHGHLAQKLKHIVLERTILPAPSESELRAQLEAHPQRYTGPASFDLTHVFISRASSGAEFEPRVETALSRLKQGVEPRSIGDHFPRGWAFKGLMRHQFEQIFQTSLEGALEPARLGAWQRLESSRGAHLIRLDAVSDGKPVFEVLRPALAADVQARKKEAAVAAYLAELGKKYPLDASAPR